MQSTSPISQSPSRALALAIAGLAGSVVLAAAAVVFVQSSFAQSKPPASTAKIPPARIAVVDVNKVLTQSGPGKAAMERLKTFQQERMAKAKEMDASVRQIDADIAAKRATLSADALADLQKQAADKRLEMQRFAQDADRELGEERDRELQALQ